MIGESYDIRISPTATGYKGTLMHYKFWVYRTCTYTVVSDTLPFVIDNVLAALQALTKKEA